MVRPTPSTQIQINESGTPLFRDKGLWRNERYLKRIERGMFQSLSNSFVANVIPYTLSISSTAAWLPLVERRIKESVIPDEYEDSVSAEWLHEDVANAAIDFFDNNADLLPNEPFIYASKGGDLVAEFTTPSGSLTTIISPDSTTIYVVAPEIPDTPSGIVLERNSNRLYEELRRIKQLLGARPHGNLESSR